MRVVDNSSSNMPVASSTVEPVQRQPDGHKQLNCQFYGKNRINCSSEVYSDPEQWRLNRDYLEQQIRILRIQLDEMKVIRKHLREMRPFGGALGAGRTSNGQDQSSAIHNDTQSGAFFFASSSSSSVSSSSSLPAANQDTLLPDKRRPPFNKPMKPSRSGSSSSSSSSSLQVVVFNSPDMK